MSDTWKLRKWDGEQWPEKRISIVDEDGCCMAISPRYASESNNDNMALMAKAPDLQTKVYALEADNAVLISDIQELETENGKLLKMYLDATDLRI